MNSEQEKAQTQAQAQAQAALRDMAKITNFYDRDARYITESLEVH